MLVSWFAILREVGSVWRSRCETGGRCLGEGERVFENSQPGLRKDHHRVSQGVGQHSKNWWNVWRRESCQPNWMNGWVVAFTKTLYGLCSVFLGMASCCVAVGYAVGLCLCTEIFSQGSSTWRLWWKLTRKSRGSWCLKNLRISLNKEPLTKVSLTNFLTAQAKIATTGQSKLCGFQAQLRNR